MSERNPILAAFAHLEKLHEQKEIIGETNQLAIDQASNVLAKVDSVSPKDHDARTEVDAILNDEELQHCEFMEKLQDFISFYENYKGAK